MCTSDEYIVKWMSEWIIIEKQIGIIESNTAYSHIDHLIIIIIFIIIMCQQGQFRVQCQGQIGKNLIFNASIKIDGLWLFISIYDQLG